jgi:hypothetical protein
MSDEKLKYTKIATEYVGVEGGGGYYDPNSGGYEASGFTTQEMHCTIQLFDVTETFHWSFSQYFLASICQ